MNVLYILIYLFYMPNFMILFYGLSNLLSHFIQLLDLKVPKLLKSYGIVRWGFRNHYMQRDP